MLNLENLGVLNYATYFVGTLFIVLLPGPNSLYVLALSARQGARLGWSALLGILVGDSLLMLATALGAVSILVTYPALFMVIKYAGAAYLIYIGYNLIKDAITTWRKVDTSDLQSSITEKRTTGAKAFKKSLLVSLLNPKAILFFLSFFAQFVDPSYPQPAVPFLILALTLQTLSLTYLVILVYAGQKLAEGFRKRQKVSSISAGGVGVGFVGFAIKLALASAS
ncbi:leucine efflux protein LeuE [Psychromonas sp. SR45-3]|uniref:leucine efflux protein LeuE n=1 Tax=Psychromonas sp. SR45-3 TaxID=2760930 RepID=UPI0015F83F46|nr:leucine efflux protein LeuE [Psychromonas sp. SR45-3]MBB1271905.1 leucine efflux protein LeuE [Psychromonas sp. SR45-3]